MGRPSHRRVSSSSFVLAEPLLRRSLLVRIYPAIAVPAVLGIPDAWFGAFQQTTGRWH